MFKNFGKVFQFTFHNQVCQKGYKALTITLAVILFLLPIGILILLAANSEKDKNKKLESCGADKIYVANDVAANTDFDSMKIANGEGYKDIVYVTVPSVDDGLKQIKDAGEKKAFVLRVTKDDKDNISTDIVLPPDTSLEAKTVKHYFDAISKNEMLFVITARGISLSDVAEISKTVETDGFEASGWKSGTSLFEDKAKANEQNNERLRDAFSVLITMIICMIMYFVVLAYGSSITKNIVMEKSSKLMDTLLISVKPEAMIFGKLSGVLTAGLLQFFSWIACLVGGVFAGVIISDKLFPGADSTVNVFLKSLGDMDLFRPIPVIVALIVLVFGILLYSSFAAFAGSISSTQEQAASNQGIFVMIMVIAYILVLTQGSDIQTAPTWLFLVPFTAALILPTGLLLGTVSTSVAIAGVAILVVLTVGLVIFAGRVYKAMALYKGQSTNFKKIFKIVSTK